MLNMTIAEFVRKSKTIRKGDKIGTYDPSPISRADWTEFATAHKAEIISYFDQKAAEEKRIRDERQAKIDAIPGLAEIRAAVRDEERYRHEFDKMMEDEGNDGAFPPKRPEVSSDALKKQYPRAAAYLLAEEWKYSEHHVKAAAGESAIEQIINGDNCDAVIARMKKTFSDYCEEHIWD